MICAIYPTIVVCGCTLELFYPTIADVQPVGDVHPTILTDNSGLHAVFATCWWFTVELFYPTIAHVRALRATCC